ncbi:MAG TPA: periplasmic heavy metal sensor [Candidatus Acidoferrales bacterium]|nr:periplasmic heavy metal sensor [Candidatus Acidoferrales bacterium]
MMLARLAENPEAREKLGLTAEQTAKIKQESFDFQKARIRDRADVELRRVELENLMHADAPDRAAIDKKLDDLSAARLVATKAEVHYHLAMREVLTPEQRQRLRDMFGERGRREGFRGPRPGGHRGPGGPPRPQAPNQE